MKGREEEILKSLLFLSEKTKGFTDPELIMIGSYALRAFILSQGSQETATLH
jgi:hypothetical protein